jgi:hypothetical protein
VASKGKAKLTSGRVSRSALCRCGLCLLRTQRVWLFDDVMLCANLVKLATRRPSHSNVDGQRQSRGFENQDGGAGIYTPHLALSECSAFLLIAYKEMLMREIVLRDADRDGETMKALVVRYDRDRSRLELAVPNTTVVFALSGDGGERFTGTLGGRTFYWDAPRGEARQKTSVSPKGGAA